MESLPIPEPLRSGDEVRVIAPAKSMVLLSKENRQLATRRLEELGLQVTFGKHVLECDLFQSSSIHSRVADLHDAFSDPNVKGILTALGGFNCSQMLSAIDYEIIRKNPKCFCGFSDITALQNAFLACSGLVTYSGPNFSTFAMEQGLEYTLASFKQMVFNRLRHTYSPSDQWSSDSEWYLDQDHRTFESNPGPRIIHEGEAEGTIVGGNLSTLVLLKGTPYMPSLENTILFVEETESGGRDVEFDRHLQSIIDLPDFEGVKGVVVGRFEKTTDIDPERLEAVIRGKPALTEIPVVYGLDFGHTTPLFTLPIGGKARLKAARGSPISLQVSS